MHFRPCIKLAVIVASTFLPLVANSQDKGLNDIQKRIDQEKGELKNLLSRESSLITMLEKLDRKIDSASQERSTYQEKKRTLQKSMREITKSQKDMTAEKTKLAAKIKKDVRAWYKLGDFGYLRLLASIETLSDLSVGSHVIKRLLRDNEEQARRFRHVSRELKIKEHEIVQEQKQLDHLIEKIAETTQDIRSKKKRQRTLLRLTQNQRDFHKKRITELDEAAANLRKLIKGAKSQKTDNPFSEHKGTLRPVVAGKIIEPFGSYKDGKFGTRSFRNGIVFGATPGDTVNAVFKGKVLFADWFKGYGKIVVIDHGDDYFTMVAHLQKILVKVGTNVDSNTQIGLVGDTGSFNGPRLYFEIRHRGQAVDPVKWFLPVLVEKE